MKYGLTGIFAASKGKGNELAALLKEASELMKHAKGCHLYLVGQQADNSDVIHVQEVWDSKDDHDNALGIAGVRELITKAMPLIEGKPQGTELHIIGGKGIED